MALSRRDFLKLGMTAGVAGALGGIVSVAGCALPKTMRGGKKTRTICSFCSLGCGIIIRTKNGIPVYVEGDKDHPMNRGSLCARAFLIPGLFDANRRVTAVKYRASGSSEWSELPWQKAISMLSERIHQTRDASFVQFDGSVTVNRTDGIAAVAGSNLTNEEAYLAAKFFRLIGVPHVATESILKGNAAHSASVRTFGMFGSTNPWTDLRNADAILIVGSNVAQRMPVAMKHIMYAKSRGAKIVCADPVVTESASVSDEYVPVMPGTDTAFVLGMINYAIINGKFDRTYLISNTDASYIVKKDFSYDRNKGIFSGYDAKTGTYPPGEFDYERDGRGNPLTDDEIRNPRTVFQLLKNHVSSYTPQRVAEITGCTVEQFLSAAELYCDNAGKEKSGAVIVGSNPGGDFFAEQTNRSLSILQLVLGNIGYSGGGIYNEEPFGNSLGVDYQIPSWQTLPGLIPLPSKGRGGEDADFVSYIKNRSQSSNNPASVNFWQNLKSYTVSLLRAWYGDKGTEGSRYNFDWLPKGNGDLGTADEWLSKFGSQYKGAILLGADIFAYGMPSGDVRKALSSLSWVAVSDIWNNDSTDFWKSSRCDTEVFLFPSETLYEKEGTLVTSSRWIEKREPLTRVTDKPAGEFRLLNDLFSAVRKGCTSSSSLPEQITYASWKYSSPDDVLREMSGYMMKNRKKALRGIRDIREDGETACGNPVFCGSYYDEPYADTDDSKGKTDAEIYPSWGYSVPGNVRVMYNGAGVEKSGYPADPRRRVLSFSDDFKGSDAPHGIDKPALNPFVMNTEGTALIFSANNTAGPFPDQFNPGIVKTTVPSNPSLKGGNRRGGTLNAILTGEKRYCLERFPQEYSFSLAGVCEIPASVASGKNIVTGDLVKISSGGMTVNARALVTGRIRCSTGGGVSDVIVLRGGAFRNFASNAHYGTVSVDISKISGGAKQ